MNPSIGVTLKEARTRKSITLEDVYAKTRIHPRVLQLLEEEKFDKLPSPLFAKSFLKSYAEFLEVNPEEVIKAYEQKGLKEPEQILFIKPAELKAEEKFLASAGADLLIPALVIIVLILAGVAVFLFKNSSVVHSQSLPVKKTKPKAESSRAKPAVEVKAESSENLATKGWLRSVAQGNFPKINRKAPLELKIKALDSVWLRITCDGKVLFQSILKRGAEESWRAGEKIEIWSGNCSNMFLILNGTAIGSPGKGVIKKMWINHDGVRLP